MLFRVGILEQAGGWEAGEDAIVEEIRITLLHEIGHQFGLDEEDLRRLGYE
jgi:predicted Zn-dependent protease with MMP-like domain